MDRTKIAITGVGAISAAGRDVDSLSARLISPMRVFGPNRRHSLLDFAVTVGEVPDSWFTDHDYPELDSPTGRLCLVAARECAKDAASRGAPHPDGLALGTSTGGQSRNEVTVFGLLDNHPPSGFSYRAQGCMAAPTRLVAHALDIHGPVQTISTACTSSANSIAIAVAWIRSGRARCVLAGGGDALCHTTIASFRALELTGPEPCTPFGANRPGMTLGEGAGFLMLESFDSVIASGRNPLAQLVGAGISSDANHMTAPPADGAGAELAMRRALADARIEPADVAHVNAHGTGTQLNDAAEAAAIERVFGSGTPVMSCKGLFGHTLGGAGGLEAVAAVLAVRERRAFENLGASQSDEDCPVTLVGPGGLELREGGIVLSNSFAFGGNNCSLVFGAAEVEQ